jgi:hypothetical protein
MSSHPVLGLASHGGERLKVVEAERGAVAPSPDRSLNGREKVVEKKGPFSLTFCQIVALMLPHPRMFAGASMSYWSPS